MIATYVLWYQQVYFYKFWQAIVFWQESMKDTAVKQNSLVENLAKKSL